MFRNSLLSQFQYPFLSPDTPTPAGGGSSTQPATPSGDMGKEDMIEFLGSDDEPETLDLTPKDKDKDKPEKKGKEKDKESDETNDKEDELDKTDENDDEELDELKEIEDELEEPTEEQLELVTPVRRREILKKYPQLFKDFPYLEKAYYREQQFTELLPTIEDAKQAVEAKSILDSFEKDLMSGNSETVLKAVKAENPNAFNKMVDGYMLTLRNVDENAYFHVLGNITKHTILAMVQEAKTSNNEQLREAALLVNQFVFGSSNFAPPTNLAKPEQEGDKDKENKISEREQSFIRQQFESTRGDLNTRVNNTLKNTIQAHIDPKQSMTEYVRRNAERDALEKLETLISKDSRFRTLVDKLWEKAYKDGFTPEAKERIKSAYLSKAKTLLPSVIKTARNEALRGTGKRVKDDNDSEIVERDNKKGPVSTGRPRSQTPAGKIKDAKDIPRGMKTIDFLNAD
jgi:hypothetical protein